MSIDADLGEEVLEKSQLDRDTDLLNEAFRDAEDAIHALDLGVSAEVQMPAPNALLSWQKRRDEWLLTVIEMKDGEVVSTTPLLKASRLLRVKAAEVLEPLLVALVDEHLRQGNAVAHAVQVVRAFAQKTRASSHARGDDAAPR